MKKRNRGKKEIALLTGGWICFFFCVCSCWLTPTLVTMAYAIRGKFAVGGEYSLLFIIPFAICGMIDLFNRADEERIERIRKERSHNNECSTGTKRRNHQR